MAKIWAIASVVCLTVAAILLLREYYDAAFVLAALGAVAWILDYRSGIRRTIVENEKKTGEGTGVADDEDEE